MREEEAASSGGSVEQKGLGLSVNVSKIKVFKINV